MLRPRPQKSPIVPDALKEIQSAHLLGKLVVELRSLYKKVEQTLQEVDRKISQQKGPKGDPGVPGPKGDNTPRKGVDYFTAKDIDQVVSLVAQRVAQFPKNGEDGYTPKKGQDYFTKEDVQEIVDLVTYRIGRPRDGKDAVIDPNMVIEAVKKQLNSDDTKKGLNQTVSAFVNQVLARGGYLHGGGDTVEAGDNITITDVNGKKRISATGGGGFNLETPTGTVNGSNVTFSATNEPTLIITDGLIRIETTDYTLSGTGPYTITMNALIPPTSFIRSIY